MPEAKRKKHLQWAARSPLPLLPLYVFFFGWVKKGWKNSVILKLGEPSARQREFLRAGTRFVAYGGARGGGKSWAVRQKALLLALRYPGIRLLLLRRSYPELRENHILPLRALCGGAAEYKESQKALAFCNGSRLKFGYCDTEDDVLQYQGQEYDVIFIDEATQFTEFQFSALTACLRGANAFPKRMYLTCNPGGVGHDWVRRLFVAREYRGKERAADYTFIPATVFDNQVLLRQDPGYVDMLENLPEDLRRAWLEGEWDAFAGQFFPEFRRQTHVIAPFPLPESWPRYFTMDYGLDMLAGYFIALDEQGRAYVYREIYESNLIASQAARRVLGCGEPIQAAYGPPDLWNRRQDTGRSVAEIFLQQGLVLQRAENQRINGWMDVKEWLHPREEGPGIQIFETCPNLIRTLQALRFAGDGSGDAATEPHELTHAPDALRYFVAGRPSPARRQKEKEPKEPFSFGTQAPAEYRVI